MAVGPATLPNGTVGTRLQPDDHGDRGSGTGYTFAVTAGCAADRAGAQWRHGGDHGHADGGGAVHLHGEGDGQRGEHGQPAIYGDDRGGDGDADGAGGERAGSLGNPPTIKVGQQAQLTATATLSGGTTADVTAQAQWSSSNPAVASVDASGKVTGVSRGDGDDHGDVHAERGDGDEERRGDGGDADPDGGAARPGARRQAERGERAAPTGPISTPAPAPAPPSR